MTTASEQRSRANVGLATGSQAAIQWQDEGGALGTAGTVTDVDFTGAGVTASRASNKVTVNIPGGAGEAFPVGAVFIAVVSTNPATLLGYGTWAAFGAGRVLVGLDAGDTDFDTVEETGGAKTATHTHGPGTLGTDTAATHTHPVGTLATAGEWSHTHGVGTLAAVAEASHTHGVGTLATSAHAGTAVGDHSTVSLGHKHALDTASYATISAHAGTAVADHSVAAMLHGHAFASSSYLSGGDLADKIGGGIRATGTTDNGGPDTLIHSVTQPNAHTLGGFTENATGLGPLTHSVTQPSAHTMSGSTAAGSSHTHGLSGSTAAGSAHNHGVTGSTDSGGAHSHAVTSGATASDAPSIVQPYIVVYMWKRTA